jgi:hypothetical protein
MSYHELAPMLVFGKVCEFLRGSDRSHERIGGVERGGKISIEGRRCVRMIRSRAESSRCICTFSVHSRIRTRNEVPHDFVMGEAEIKRLRREIHRTFGSSPHKKKFWLALLEMYGATGRL